VLGPKELPVYLRKAGQLAGRVRRMAYEMREKSGIDEVLRTEGIDRDIAEIRRLARGEITGVMGAVRSAVDPLRAPGFLGAAAAPSPLGEPATGGVAGGAPVPVPADAPLPAHLAAERAREYPPEGPDAYGALPDTATVYEGGLAESPLASDALYARGEAA
jgi:hypothetical protein